MIAIEGRRKNQNKAGNLEIVPLLGVSLSYYETKTKQKSHQSREIDKNSQKTNKGIPNYFVRISSSSEEIFIMWGKFATCPIRTS